MAVELRYLFLVLLAVQNSASTLLRRYSVGILKEKYSSSSVLGVAEVMKFIVSFLMLEDSPDAFGTSASTLRRRLAALKHAMWASLPMMVPAVVYLLMNMLSFVALERIDATVFAMVAQLKLLTTAMFSFYVLGRVLSCSQWRAISMITAAVMVIAYERGHTTVACFDRSDVAQPLQRGTIFSGSFMMGLIAIAIEVTLSGWMGCYFEKYLKDGKFSVWGRNLQVSVWSILGYALTNMLQVGMSHGTEPVSRSEDSDEISLSGILTSFFAGWSFITWMIAFLMAAGGLLVAFATKHADAVAKTIATSVALVLVVILEILLFGVSADPIVVLPSLIVLLAMETYREAGQSNNASQLAAKPYKSSATNSGCAIGVSEAEVSKLSSGDEMNR